LRRYMKMNVTTTTKAINSKKLFSEVNDLIKDGIFSVELDWQDDEERSVFVDFLNSLLHEFWNNGNIEQWKVQCNNLNNTTEDMMNGKFILEVHYKQKHCLNTSKITYEIQE